MILAVDIGNTNISLGIYKNNILSEKFYIPEESKSLHEYGNILHSKLTNTDISGCIISSVNDKLTSVIFSEIKNIINTTPIIVSTNINLGIKINSKTPERIGTDRLVNVFAANKFYSKPAIVIDLGSATTFDIINEKGEFIGGIIMPGLNMQLHSLCNNTSKLPIADLNNIKFLEKTINIDTENAILSGVVNGQIQAIKGLINSCKQELTEQPIIIGTGGNAKLIEEFSSERLFDIVHENLTLDGLNILYSLNQ